MDNYMLIRIDDPTLANGFSLDWTRVSYYRAPYFDVLSSLGVITVHEALGDYVPYRWTFTQFAHEKCVFLTDDMHVWITVPIEDGP